MGALLRLFRYTERHLNRYISKGRILFDFRWFVGSVIPGRTHTSNKYTKRQYTLEGREEADRHMGRMWTASNPEDLT